MDQYLSPRLAIAIFPSQLLANCQMRAVFEFPANARTEVNYSTGTLSALGAAKPRVPNNDTLVVGCESNDYAVQYRSEAIIAYVSVFWQRAGAVIQIPQIYPV